MNLLNSNCLIDFATTPQFKFCCLLLNHPSYRMKRSVGDKATAAVAAGTIGATGSVASAQAVHSAAADDMISRVRV
jgi:hypothetical protein